jgi:hypothetical protein
MSSGFWKKIAVPVAFFSSLAYCLTSFAWYYHTAHDVKDIIEAAIIWIIISHHWIALAMLCPCCFSYGIFALLRLRHRRRGPNEDYVSEWEVAIMWFLTSLLLGILAYAGAVSHN